MKQFDRFKMRYFPLTNRINKVEIVRDCVELDAVPKEINKDTYFRIEKIAEEILDAKKNERAVICAFGAHAIKNGLGKLLSFMIGQGWFTHLATNGAGVIHDWEFAFQGMSSEDVRKNVQEGKFGTWQETGSFINTAIVDGAYRGFGYGESVGKMINKNGLQIPAIEELLNVVDIENEIEPYWRKAAAADYLDLIQSEELNPGWLNINHPFSEYSIQAGACRLDIPLTSHPMFGHDIIYTHKANKGASIGRCAERDFLSFVDSVSNLSGGVYISVGSAVMSPMIFEKSLSMARNVMGSQNQINENCNIHVVDLQEETWDWSRGEPPMDNPAYYLRFMKSFNRMGCRVDYTSLDNKTFFLHLYNMLKNN